MPSLGDVRREAGQDIGGFKKFILRGNVVDLAVGIVIGAAFSGVVQALVKDIITPLIGMLGGIPDFSSWAITVKALGSTVSWSTVMPSTMSSFGFPWS